MDVKAFVLSHLVEVELQCIGAFEFDRQVTEDEERTLCVVGILETMKRGDKSAGERCS
jgi:hypothetical protein